jgi:hypothetical protein
MQTFGKPLSGKGFGFAGTRGILGGSDSSDRPRRGTPVIYGAGSHTDISDGPRLLQA